MNARLETFYARLVFTEQRLLSIEWNLIRRWSTGLDSGLMEVYKVVGGLPVIQGFVGSGGRGGR